MTGAPRHFATISRSLSGATVRRAGEATEEGQTMSEIEREVLEVDVLIVGAGPGGLGAAIRLAQLAEEHGQDDLMIAVIEKAAEVGFHSCSGAVMDPRGIAELIPDYRAKGCPIEGDVVSDEVWYLHEQEAVPAPFTPKPLQNHGCHVMSLGRLTAWLGEQAEATGKIDIFTETAGAEILYAEQDAHGHGDGHDDHGHDDHGHGSAAPAPRVIGVRTGDKGRDKDGNPKANFEPGIDIHAKVTILGEGVRGSLAKGLIEKLHLDADSHAQVYALGIKELWQMPKGSVTPGEVIHTMGWPLRDDAFGGGFIYTMADDIIDIGLVVGLDYKDPMLEPHKLFQQLKTHPLIAKLLDGGKMIQYGAKALPEGGYHSIPRPYAEGVLLCGDTASFLNPMRLKGIHTALKTGMLAAETVMDCITHDDFSLERLSLYKTRIGGSWVEQELRFSRNFHAGFRHGTMGGLINSGFILATNGHGIMGAGSGRPGHEEMETVEHYVDAHVNDDAAREFRRPKYDGELTFDKLTNVYHSGTKHEEDQPCHLQVADTDLCVTRCTEEYANPCTRFCPAQVYNIVDDEAAETGTRLQIDFSNCVHCKTCDIADPYQVITWVTPEGGDGPRYDRL
jgi:electron-transferring-flavoprotein dehydrogenase